ncbi:MAG: WG repeat-containing protein [Cyanobacteriota/Melainabacteria group bacterium]
MAVIVLGSGCFGSFSELHAQGLVLDPPRTQVIRAIDRDGTILFESREFANLGSFSEGLAPFAILNKIQMGRTWGYVDTTGKIVIEPKYSYADDFRNGKALVETNRGRLSIIDRSGCVLKEFDKEYEFSLRTFGFGGRYPADKLYLSKEGPLRRKPREKNQSVSGLGGGKVLRLEGIPHAHTMKGRKLQRRKTKPYSGVLSDKGKVIVPFKYDSIIPFSEDLAAVCCGKSWGYVDLNGVEVIPLKYACAMDFSEGCAVVGIADSGSSSNSLFHGCVDRSGNVIIPIKYCHLGPSRDGRLSFRERGCRKFGFLNRSGEVVISARFDEVGDFSEGVARVRVGKSWGLIDRSGDYLVEPNYCFLGDMINDSVAFATNMSSRKSSIVNPLVSKHWAIPLLSYQVDRKNPLEPLTVNDFLKPRVKFGLLDKNGKEILSSHYDYIGPSVDGLRRVVLDQKVGFVTDTGEEAISPRYDFVSSFSDGVATVEESDRKVAYTPVDNGDPIYNLALFDMYPESIDPDLFEENIRTCSKVIDSYPNSGTAFRMRGWYYYALRRNEEALNDFNRAVKMSPEESDFREARGYLYLRLQKWEEAEQDFADSIALRKPLFPGGEVSCMDNAGYGLNCARIAQGKLEKFKGQIRLAEQNWMFPLCQRPFGSYLYSEPYVDACVSLGKYDAAVEALLASNSCTNPIPQFLIYPETKTELMAAYDKAEALLESELASSVHPFKLLRDRVDILIQLIRLKSLKTARYEIDDLDRLLRREAEISKAIDAYEIPTKNISIAKPGKTQEFYSWLHLANYYAEVDDIACEAIYKELMKAKYIGCVAGYDYALFLSRKGKYKEALQLLSKGYSYELADRRRFVIYKRLGDKEQAKKVEAALDKRIQERKARWKTPCSDYSQNYELYCASTLPVPPLPDGRDESAEYYFELAKRSNDLSLVNLSLGYIDKALSLAKDGQLKKDLLLFRRTRLPDSKISLKTIASYCALNFDNIDRPAGFPEPIYSYVSEIKESLNKCIEEEPGFLQPYAKLMQIAITEGDYEEAGRVFDRVMKVNPDCLGAWVEAGRMYRYSGNNTKAREAFLKVQELDPGNQLARRMLSILRPVH